ncbi:hypothetical protein BDW22DRAFT_1218868 [Trametopsis cervina]|nr:hypothetical protein BDW22DRAFT_1218868 [Trametopsis cervina]
MQTIFIDDSELSILHYAGHWKKGGVPQEFNVTTHGSLWQGAQVSLTFQGTSIQVLGSIGTTAGDGMPVTSYVLDDGEPTTYTAPETSKTTFRQTFYTSPQLSDGEHSLTVNLISNGSTYWLDYFAVTQNKASLPSSSSVLATTISIETSSPTTASESPDHGTGSRSLQPGAIAGIVLGVLVFVGAVIAVIWLCVRRSRTRKESTVDMIDNHLVVYTGICPI